MITINTWTKIRSLSTEGHSIRSIARMVGASRNTVRKALKESNLPKYSRTPCENKLIREYEELVLELMSKKLIGTRIYKEICKVGYTGSITTLYRFINSHKENVEAFKTTVRFETNPGEQAQFDWSPYSVVIAGEIVQVYCFLTILSYSRKKQIVFSKTQRIEAVLDALESGIRGFNGVPKQVVIDNAKQLVLSHPRDDQAVYHPKFLELAGTYRFSPYACQTYWPRTKGKVERPFYYIEQHFIKGNEFNSFEELQNRAEEFIHEWELEPNKTTLVPPAILYNEEQPVLMELPISRYSHHLKETRKVSWDCLVSYRGVKYSVPNQYAGKSIWLNEKQGHLLQILNESGMIVCEHILSTQKGATVINEVHYEGVKGSTPKSLPKVREKFIDTFSVGKEYTDLLKTDVKANHTHRYRNILELLNHYEVYQVEEVLKQAILYKRTEYNFLVNLLKNIARKKTIVPQASRIPDVQTKTRSLDYYSGLLH
ncbi:IS21 family transposase [Bacillus sp. AFS017336]|uniref:IS21 family transposase n=1 Tax=Bacillus sp. AFS017336 TaxID=2033489 RepID=UPI0015CF2C50|nr:IS21 family transposase [Bacillus sp. AFS017336]